MSEQQTQTQKSGWRTLCFLLVGMLVYLGWKEHLAEQRTAPQPPATFESRVESVRSEGTDWATGYFYVVGKTTSEGPGLQKALWQPQPQLQQQPQPQPQLQQQLQPKQRPQALRRRSPDERLQDWAQRDPILESLRRQNEEFARSLREAPPNMW
jgi:hypothetical protein